MNKLLIPKQEAIAPQVNDKSILEIKNIFGLIREDVKKTYGKNLKQYLDEIGKILTRRFGIPVKMMNDSKHVGPWTVTYSFIDDRTGFDKISDVVKDGASWLMKLFASNEVKRLEKGVELFDVYMKNNDIMIDLNKAYVYGLPKDYDCVISCSWTDLFTPDSMWYAENDDMVVGVLLHEMGHVFSRLEYLYKTKSTVLALEEAMRDAMKVKSGQGYSYAIAYRKNMNPDFNSEQYKDANIPTIAIGILKDIKDRYNFSMSKRSSTNMEYVADQFSSRFGYGEATQTYLYNIMKDGIEYYDNPTRAGTVMGQFIFIVFLFAGIFLCGGFATFTGILVGTISFVTLTLLSVIRQLKSDNEYEATYDIPYQRVEKTVLDYIRQLRLYGDKLDKKEKQRILVAVDNLTDILKQIKNSGAPVNTVAREKIFEFLNGKIKNVRELSEFSENVERLMENKLHVDVRRF